jgi:hypothetical protein
VIPGLISATKRKDKHTSGVQSGDQPGYHIDLLIKWYMPDAIPGGNEVVLPRRRPLADIALMKRHLWMLLSGQRDHFARNIHSLRRKAFIQKQINKSAGSAASHIQRTAPAFDKRYRLFMLTNTIVSVEPITCPSRGDLIVCFADILRFHISKGLMGAMQSYPLHCDFRQTLRQAPPGL